MAEVKILREFFDIMKSKGRVLDEATLAKPSALSIEAFAARRAGGDAAAISGAEKTAIKSFTTDVLDQLRKANGGTLSPMSLIQAQEAYAAAVVRRFGPGDQATNALNDFKASIKEVLLESAAGPKAKRDVETNIGRVEGIAQRRAERQPAAAPAPAPAPAAAPAPATAAAPPAAASPAPAPAAWDPKADADSRSEAARALSEAQKDVAAQADRIAIRAGMATARGDVSQGMLKFKSSTTYEDKLAAFERMDGKVDGENKQVFSGIRRSGWISDYQSPYETGSQTSWILTRHSSADTSKELFDDPVMRKRLRDYVAAGKFNQENPPIGVETLRAAGKPSTDTEIDAALDSWIKALKVEFEANKKAGLVTPLDKDGLRTTDQIEKLLENRSMTPLADDNVVVQNAPGAWILPEEWTKLRAKYVTELRGIQLKEAIAQLRDFSKQLDTVNIDTDAMKKHFDLHRELSRSPELRANMPLTDSAKYQVEVDAEVALAAREGRPVDPNKFPAGGPPQVRDANALFADLYGGKLLSEAEIAGLEKHFRANKLQTEVKVQVSGLRNLLADEGQPTFKVEEVRGALDAMRAIERRQDYIELTERSPAAAAHDAAVAAAARGGPAPGPRKIEDVRQDLFDGARITKNELYQLEEHYRALFRATQIREQVRPLQEMLRKADTSDLPIDKHHPVAASTFGGKGVHETLEEIRRLSNNPMYQSRYPQSPDAIAAERSGTVRDASAIMSDLTGGKYSVSDREFLMLEGHLRAGYLRASIAETLERGVKLPSDPLERAQTLRDVVSGTKPYDTVFEGSSTRPRTIEQAMLELGRRIDEEVNWRRANNVPDPHAAAAGAGRSIHQIVDDIREGRISPRQPGALSLQDAATFAGSYKQFLSGEALDLQAQIHGNYLMRIYEQSNGLGKNIAKRDIAEIEKRFTELERIMESADYKFFTKPMRDADPNVGEQARKNITNILKDLRAGKPISIEEVTRAGEFFQRWHARDESTFGTGGLFRLFGPRFMDRQTGSMWNGVLGATAVTGALVLGGTGISALTGGGSAPTVPAGGGNNTTQVVPGGGQGAGGTAPSAGPTLFPQGATTTAPTAGDRITRLVDRFVGAAEGGVGTKTQEVYLYQQMTMSQDRANQAAFLGQVGKISEALRERSPGATLNLDAMAAQIADRMYKKLLEDRDLTVGEGVDAYLEVIEAAPAEIKTSVGPAIRALAADIAGATGSDGRPLRDQVVLRAGAPAPTNP